jgi:hypothetical protein
MPLGSTKTEVWCSFRRDNIEHFLMIGGGTDTVIESNIVASGAHERAIKARWICEQAHQQLKEELGLDHFEGRSWQGLHRHRE